MSNERPKREVMTLRVPPAWKQRVEAYAAAKGLTVNAAIIVAMDALLLSEQDEQAQAS